ncbi:MHYT domain-containing protein [Nonomuraea sp. NPDC003804]|uniref:MHYT domain-containing protein n=1 Tax=Nonomuraea sp. NPDC003804 TaxID=3154547 RepID=UPI00339F4AEE
MNHFTQGPLTPILAYVMSCMGSMLGLRLTAQANASTGSSRARWLIGAAISIGGTGIWVMHFIAMMGFDVEGTEIRYDVPLTVASALVAVVVVGAGLFLVSFGRAKALALLGGGLLTGLGVAAMHYMGMYAMNMSAHVTYDPVFVGASVVIAVVAATVALWFTLRVRRALAITGAALIMGVAVAGMHYTGMFGMSVQLHTASGHVAGADALSFLVPLMTVVSLITLTMLLMVILSPSQAEMQEDAELMARLEMRRQAAESAQTLRAPVPAGPPAQGRSQRGRPPQGLPEQGRPAHGRQERGRAAQGLNEQGRPEYGRPEYGAAPQTGGPLPRRTQAPYGRPQQHPRG